ncbi:EscF/YscF/HrpA family type III secretion system needle major subunit [Pararoseomonas sp. SCSIO 73927]|uniref:EscF/YscF/HrpA family type III secretion system needle major subunit n=1 Tax=Pararoseomonas sp. SCSIO 73927 TaxID=3114537 RepID=UPI0030CB5D57
MSDKKEGPQRLGPDELNQVTGGGSGIAGSGFNYQQLADTMGQGTATTEASLHAFSQTMDTGSAADMIKLQNMTQQWNMAVDLQSNTIKMIGDSLKGIVSKIG